MVNEDDSLSRYKRVQIPNAGSGSHPSRNFVKTLVAISQHGEYVAVGSGKQLSVVTVKSQQLHQSSLPDAISSMDWSNVGQQIVIGFENGIVGTYKLEQSSLPRLDGPWRYRNGCSVDARRKDFRYRWRRWTDPDMGCVCNRRLEFKSRLTRGVSIRCRCQTIVPC